MILLLLAIRDSASGSFDRPFVSLARGASIRAFSDEINKPNTQYNAHPDDYELYYLGTFDDGTASFDLLSSPELLVRGKDLIRKDSLN